MLAQHTLIYTRILSEGGETRQYQQARETILLLQKEIASRKPELHPQLISQLQPFYKDGPPPTSEMRSGLTKENP